jgi:hypothetical protein
MLNTVRKRRQPAWPVLLALGLCLLLIGCGAQRQLPASESTRSPAPDLYEIEVRIISVQGQPIAGAMLEYKRDRKSDQYFPVRDVMTDAAGVARFKARIQAATIEVRVTAAGYYQESQILHLNYDSPSIVTLTLEPLP